jgi:hypothetical protein
VLSQAAAGCCRLLGWAAAVAAQHVRLMHLSVGQARKGVQAMCLVVQGVWCGMLDLNASTFCDFMCKERACHAHVVLLSQRSGLFVAVLTQQGRFELVAGWNPIFWAARVVATLQCDPPY